MRQINTSLFQPHWLSFSITALAVTLFALPALAQDSDAPEAMEAVRMEEEVGADESAEMADGELVVTDEVSAEEGVMERDERLTSPNVNLDGAVGFHQIASAKPGEALTFRAAFLGEFFSASDIVRQQDENARTVGRLVIQGTLLEFLALNFGVKTQSNVNTFGQPEAMLTMGDMNIGLGGYYPVSDFFHIGADFGVFIPAGFGSTGLDLGSTSVRPRLLATLDTRAISNDAVAMDVHFNLGYRFDNSENGIPEGVDVTRVERFAYNLNAYNMVELGIGAEYDLPYVRPFAGFSIALPVGGSGELCESDRALGCASELGAGKVAPKLLSLGLKAEPVDNLGLHAGVDLGLTTEDAEGLPVTSPYNVIFGVSWTIDPRPKVEYVEVEKVIEKTVEAPAAEATKGMIAGTIVDEATNETIKRAVIEYLSEDVSAQSSSAVNGQFKSYAFEPGKVIKMRISHPDYEPAEVSATIQEGTIPLNVALKAIPKIANIKGRVLDEKDKPVKLAGITIVGKDGKEMRLPVDAGGNFVKEIPAGDYSITARADGFMTRGRDITIEANDNMTIDIVLLPQPEKIVVKLRAEKIEIQEKVFFETGEAVILPKSFNLLNQVASVIADNPQIRAIQIEGHTDDVGKSADNLDLSQRRAEAVKKYLQDQGVSPTRLKAKGFGSGNPILPNTTNRNRALNRRVEFNIVQQKPAEVDSGN